MPAALPAPHPNERRLSGAASALPSAARVVRADAWPDASISGTCSTRPRRRDVSRAIPTHCLILIYHVPSIIPKCYCFPLLSPCLVPTYDVPTHLSYGLAS